MESHTIVIGDPTKVVVVNSNDANDVVIVGDPSNIIVKPKKR